MADSAKDLVAVDLAEVGAVSPEPPPAYDPPAVEKVEFARPLAHQQIWEALVSDLETQRLTSDSTLAGELRNSALRIESGFSFTKEPFDDSFHPLHVEPLLDQAADLLDRCLRDRAAYDDLAAKALNQLLELFEYAELDRIHSEEEREGAYDTPAAVSAADFLSDRLQTLGNSQAASSLTSLINSRYSSANIYAMQGAEQLSSWLQGLVAYYMDGQKLGAYGSATWNGASRQLHDHYFNAGVTRSHHATLTEYAQVMLQRLEVQYAHWAFREREAGSKAQSVWDAKNAVFLRRRTLVARKFQDIRLKAATAADGILNYSKRLSSLRERFHRDFRDALARMNAVHVGLREVYAYSEPLPTSPEAIDYYDRCLLWVRGAIQWLIRFSRREQSFVLPVSVKDLAGPAGWKEGIKTGVWNFPVGGFLEDLKHVRLRGISATVRDRVGYKDRLWQLDVVLPESGVFHHLEGTEGHIDQSDLPSVLLGRVVERDFVRDPDIAGVVAIHNASPLGSWRVSIVASVPSADAGEPLDDLMLDLHLSFRRSAAS